MTRLIDLIRAFSPRISRPLSDEYDWLIYTDAATNPPCLCALIFNPMTAAVRLDAQLVAFARPWTSLFKDTCLISGLEHLALTAFFEDMGPMLEGESIRIYMDSNNFLSAVTRDASNTVAIAIPVGRLRATLKRHRIYAWFSRVPSKHNPADLPTRNRRMHFTASRKDSFKSISSLYRLVRSQLKKFDFIPRNGAKIRIKPSHRHGIRL